jgi:hypothetical protein
LASSLKSNTANHRLAPSESCTGATRYPIADPIDEPIVDDIFDPIVETIVDVIVELLHPLSIPLLTPLPMPLLNYRFFLSFPLLMKYES